MLQAIRSLVNLAEDAEAIVSVPVIQMLRFAQVVRVSGIQQHTVAQPKHSGDITRTLPVCQHQVSQKAGAGQLPDHTWTLNEVVVVYGRAGFLWQERPVKATEAPGHWTLNLPDEVLVCHVFILIAVFLTSLILFKYKYSSKFLLWYNTSSSRDRLIQSAGRICGRCFGFAFPSSCTGILGCGTVRLCSPHCSWSP